MPDENINHSISVMPLSVCAREVGDLYHTHSSCSKLLPTSISHTQNYYSLDVQYMYDNKLN